MATLLQEFTELVAAFNRRHHGGHRRHGFGRRSGRSLASCRNVEGQPLHFHDGAIEIRRISKIDAETKVLFTIDFLLVTDATRQICQNRETVKWEHGAISAVSREGLIQLKRISGRLQDIADIERLENES